MEKYICYCFSCKNVCYSTNIGKIICPICGSRTISTSVWLVHWNGYSNDKKRIMMQDFEKHKYTRGRLFKIFSIKRYVGKVVRENRSKLKCDTHLILDSEMYAKLLRYYYLGELIDNQESMSNEEYESICAEIDTLISDIEEYVALQKKEEQEKKKLAYAKKYELEKQIASLDGIKNGKEFEKYCKQLLIKNGYKNVNLTPAVGDHGADILATDGLHTYAIQCKCYSNKVGNSAVQQIYSAKMFYEKEIGIVMTNSYFTAQAKKEAHKLGIKLWDREIILSMAQTSSTN